MKIKTILFSVFAFFLLTFYANAATVYYVSTDGNDSADGKSWNTAFQSIIKAVQSSVSGDSIWVKAGEYKPVTRVVIPQNISIYGGFIGTETNPSQRDLTNYTSSIDGDTSNQCVLNYGYIDGFYISNGRSNQYGGGIFNSGGTINNCKITRCKAFTGGGVYSINGRIMNSHISSNTADDDGAGIHNLNGEITNCEVYNNIATLSEYADGAGIYNYMGIVDSCKVHNNVSGNSGGGIMNYEGLISNTEVYTNHAEGNGGGIYNFQAQLIGPAASIKTCSIHNNTSGDGAGIYNKSGSILTSKIFRNISINTSKFLMAGSGGINSRKGSVKQSYIYENDALNGSAAGATLYSTDISNSVIYGNNGYGVYLDFASMNSCTVYGNKSIGVNAPGFSNVTNSIIWNNDSNDFVGNPSLISYSCFSESDGSGSCIKANPMFVNTIGNLFSWNFHLQNGSPCIDNGNPGNTANDIEGHARPGKDAKTCMGAYESQDDFLPSAPKPPRRYYISTSGNNTDGSNWQNAFTDINHTFNHSDDLLEVWVSEGTYILSASLEINARAKYYGSFAGTETDLSQRNINAHPTIIDGNQKSFNIINNYILDGFHITNINYTAGDYSVISNNGILSNCSIYNNYASTYRTIMSFNSKNTSGENLLIYNNESESSEIIYIYYGIIKKCRIFNNTTGSYGSVISNRLGQIENEMFPAKPEFSGI